MTAPPATQPVVLPAFDAIPMELRQANRWHVWRYEQNDKPKPTKVPYQVHASDYRASTTKPVTWASFPEASALLLVRRAYDGIGFALGDNFAGIDIDHVRHPETGYIEPWALEIIATLDTYAEVSPSREGVKLFLRGDLKNRERNRLGQLPDWQGGLDAEVEMYWQTRFFTVTGNHLPGTPLTVNERQQQLDRLHLDLFPPRKPNSALIPPRPLTLNDTEIEERIRQSKQWPKFSALMEGDLSAYGGDESRADAALCRLLAFWWDRDPAAMDRVFRTSKLFREKWDSKRGETTYGAITIQKAIELTPEGYTGVKARTGGGSFLTGRWANEMAS